jgi:hypothetical protein
MTKTAAVLVRGFLKRNAHVQLLRFDFHDPSQLATLKGTAKQLAEEIPQLKRIQRLRRLHNDHDVALSLSAAGFGSAHEIADTPLDRFVLLAADTTGLDEIDLARMHETAVQVTRRAQHLAANIHALVASPHWRNAPFANTDPKLIAYFEGIPSYADLFGTLDFCRCPDCRSIFSPAAYLLDLLRVTEKYITQRSSIPDGYKLKDRRPDLFSRKLDCANTNDPAPYLRIVNEVLLQKLERDGVTDIWQKIAAAAYPMTLPFLLPLETMRLALARLDLTPAEIWRSVLELRPESIAVTAPAVALAATGVSPDLARLVTTPDPSPKALALAWGFDVVTHLPFQGTGTVKVTQGSKAVEGTGVDFNALTPKQQIRLAGMTRTIVTIDTKTKLTVDTAFGKDASGAAFTVIPVESLSLVPVFSYHTGLAVEAMNELFVQGSSAKELQDGVAKSFFINDTGEALPPLRIDNNITGSSDPVPEIVGIDSFQRLDRLHRFLRLSRATGIPFASLDTLIRVSGQKEITREFLTLLGGIQAFAAAATLTWTEAAAFLADIETIRKGDGRTPVDLFDVVFNNPALLGGRDPYTATPPIPFDPSRPLTWHVGQTTQDAPTLPDRLAAALRISQTDLNAVGTFLVSALGLSAPQVPLTLQNLTFLYRLTLLPLRMRWKIDEFFNLFRLVAYPGRPVLSPPKGVLTPGAGKPADLLALAVKLVDAMNAVAASPMSVYEIGYMVTGDAGTKLRIGVDPTTIPRFLASTVASSAATLVTPAALVVGDLDEAGAESAFQKLVALSLVNASGVALRNAAAWSQAAALPANLVTPSRLAVAGTVTPEEAKEAFATLQTYTPPLLVAKSATEATLSSDWTGVTQLAGLFPLDAAAQVKRAALAAVLDSVRAAIVAAEYAPAVTIDASAFVTASIDATAAAVVFSTLLAKGVLVDAKDQRASVSPSFTQATQLGYLFQSAGAGQQRTITAYDGATRVATVDAAWATNPDAFSIYEVRSGPLLLTRGTAVAATATTLTLAAGSSDEKDAYKDVTLAIVADDLAAAKIDEVRNALLATQAAVAAVGETVERLRAAQIDSVVNALADYLRLDPALVAPLLPFAAPAADLERLPVDFLSPPAGPVPPAVVAIVNGLVRAGLLADKLSLDAPFLLFVARTPAPYQIAALSAPSFDDVIRLAGLRRFQRDVGDDTGATLLFFAAAYGAACPDAKISFLATITGWPAAQICAVIALLWPGGGERRPKSLADLLRLQAPFGVLAQLGATPDYLSATLAVSSLVTGTAAAWTAYQTAADATLSVVNARFNSPDGAEAWEELRSQIEESERDALVAFAIVFLQQTKKLPIYSPSDLFQFLLIDVEMSGCDVSSYIAQGIASVQLYMQRVRMRLEPGANADSIAPIWWDWLSTYRAWEVNRKVFLYPENYVDPTLRRDTSPPFAELADQLLRSAIDDDSVLKAYMTYFQGFSLVAELVHVGAYSTRRLEPDGEKRTETLYLVGRTNTDPYRFFVRTLERSSLCSTETWSPWREIGETIKAELAVPVYAFDRLFVFWSQIEPQKSSAIKTEDAKPESTSQSVTRSTWRYSFQTVTGEWVAAQTIGLETPDWVAFNPNTNLKDPAIAKGFLQTQHWWRQPYVQTVERGIPASGTLSFAAGSSEAAGTGTQLARQVEPGDRIRAAGEEQLVTAVDAAAQKLTIASKWSVGASKAAFKVLPRDPNQATFRAFEGAGSIIITKNFDLVRGYDSDFQREVTIGDRITATALVGGAPVTETRAVADVTDQNELLVDEPWTIETNFFNGTGTVDVFYKMLYVDGKNNTKFESQFKVGDFIRVGPQIRRIDAINSDLQMEVDEAWDDTIKDSKYVGWVPMTYTVVPRTNGEERMMIVDGPGLPIKTLPAAAGEIKPNPGEDPFIASLNAFNANLNDTLDVAKTAKSVDGRIAPVPATLVTSDLETRATRLLVADDQGSAVPSTSPVRANLSRENALLTLVPGKNLLFDAYWSNSTPGTVVDDAAAPARTLFYNIDARRSLSLNVANQIGWFLFNNSNDAYLLRLQDPTRVQMSATATLQPWSTDPIELSDTLATFGPISAQNTPFDQLRFGVERLTTSVVSTLQQRLFSGGIDRLLRIENQRLDEIPFNTFYAVPQGPPPSTLDPKNLPPPRMDWHGSYALYFSEVFFHAPLLIADRLRANGNYAEAKRWYEYIFNPTAPPDPLDQHPNDRYWRYLPFRTMDLPTLREVLTDPCEIDAYHNDPFNPDAIAALRISAYAKATVMKYVDNLISWGDSLFAQDTRESVAQATQIYVLAQDLLGPRPIPVGDCYTPPALSFDELSERFPDGIPEFLIELENTPLLDACSGCRQFSAAPVNAFPAYFCIPENAELIAYWDRVEDRLYKIRHCMNLQGEVRRLPLFAPPLDVRAFIQAYGATGAGAAAGVGMPASVPAFRFTYLLGQAQSLAATVSGLGGSLLSALERQDGETLTLLLNTQELALLDRMTFIKEQQIAALAAEKTGLTAALDSANDRAKFYRKLLDDGYNAAEIANLVLIAVSAGLNSAAALFNAVATVAFLFPQAGSPFAMTFGGEQIGASASAAGASASSIAAVVASAAEASAIVAGYQRRAQEWGLQKTLAEYDGKQFQAQIDAVGVQTKIAERDLDIHLRSIANLEAQARFYRTKFTNQQLYAWISGRLATTYFQAYQLAVDLGRMAQSALEFELGRSERATLGSWDTARKGLTAGETLMLALAQLERSYLQTGSARRLSIERTISLRQLDPLAYLRLVRTGECLFELPERLFDADYPGHYKRRIHSVAVTLPAVVGPYQNLRATLTQTSNYIVVEPKLDAVKFLLGEGDAPPAGTLLSNVRPQQQIALSTGAADPGVFADADAERYLPFEGTGAVSSWRLSMPQSSNPFALANVSDVVLTLRYFAEDGGAGFRRDVAGLDPVRTRDWPVLLLLAQSDPTAWFAFLEQPPSGTKQQLRTALPPLAVPGIANIEVRGVYVGLAVAPKRSTASAKPYLSIEVEPGKPVALPLAATGDALHLFATPIRIEDLADPTVITFDLAPGYTPDSLRTADKKVLDPEALLNIHLVWFLTGRATP